MSPRDMVHIGLTLVTPNLSRGRDMAATKAVILTQEIGLDVNEIKPLMVDYNIFYSCDSRSH